MAYIEGLLEAGFMKIGIISDIHGNNLALKAVLSVLLNEVDQILFLGDLCGYYPFVNECLALWDETCIIGIRGNHDQGILECLQNKKQPSIEYETKYGSALTRILQTLSSDSKLFLQSVPRARTLKLNGGVLVMYHGAAWD